VRGFTVEATGTVLRGLSPPETAYADAGGSVRAIGSVHARGTVEGAGIVDRNAEPEPLITDSI
jgi:hypothetical protein